MTSNNKLSFSWFKDNINNVFEKFRSLAKGPLLSEPTRPTRPSFQTTLQNHQTSNQPRPLPYGYNRPYITPYRPTLLDPVIEPVKPPLKAPATALVTASDFKYFQAKDESINTYNTLEQYIPNNAPKISSYNEFMSRYEALENWKEPPSFIQQRLNSNVKQLREERFKKEQQHYQQERRILAEKVRHPVQKQCTLSNEAFYNAYELYKDRDIIDRKEFYRKPQLPKLTNEHDRLIDQASRSPTNATLVELEGLRITSKDIQTLMRINWLNDEVINFYLTLIVERAKGSTKLPKVYSFNTFFYVTLRPKGYSSVRRWTRKVDIFSYDLITVPVHVGQNHWCLASIDFRSKRISYYDSLGGSSQGCQQLLAKYLQEESLDKKKQEFSLDGWQNYTGYNDIPQQKNGSDCGVFTCTYAEYMSRDAELDFEQKDMPYFRRKMIVEILMKKLLT